MNNNSPLTSRDYTTALCKVIKLAPQISLKKTLEGTEFRNDIAYDPKGNAVVCPDQYVGILSVKCSIFGKRVAFVSNYINNTVAREDASAKIGSLALPVIAVVFDAPEADDFGKNNCVNGPACGQRGVNVSGVLCEELMKYMTIEAGNGEAHRAKRRIKSGKYALFFINAVQYRCSLGYNCDEVKRRKIFDGIWNPKGSRDFVRRLSAASPAYIINCCSELLSQKVQCAVAELPEPVKLIGFDMSTVCYRPGFSEYRSQTPG